MQSQISWAVITPSYNLDFERCRILCRSMDAFLSGPWHHYIIVDPPDYALFKSLSGPRRTVIVKDDILPKGLRYAGKVPFMRLGRFWLGLRHGAVFGWQMQQFIKLMMAEHCTEDALLICDSDTLFLKPFDVAELSRGGKVRFCSVEFPALAENPNVAASIRVLGLEPKSVTRFWVGDVYVTWRRQTVRDMQAYISNLHGKAWHEAIGYSLKVAEYHLYGTYVNYVQKDSPHLYLDNASYCTAIWSKEQAEATDLSTFCRNLVPPAVAACVQSLIGIDVPRVAAELDHAIAAQGIAPAE